MMVSFDHAGGATYGTIDLRCSISNARVLMGADSGCSRSAIHQSELSNTDPEALCAPWNNICFPSGNHTGKRASANCAWSCRDGPPAAGTIYILPLGRKKGWAASLVK